MLLANFMGMVAMLIPGYLHRKARLDIPSKMMIIYAIFLYCGIY
jgi:hypothetical protein